MRIIARTDDDFGSTDPARIETTGFKKLEEEEAIKSILKKYNIAEETKWYMDYDNFDKLVRDHLPELTKQERYKKFECIAEFEWNNYSNYDTEVDEKDSEDSIYIKYDKKYIMKGKSGLGFHSILTFLVENKILPTGKYVVEVFW